MELKLKIKCSCFCSYTLDQSISEKEVSCPNCGKIPSFSKNLIEMLKIANQIPDMEKDTESGHELSIHALSFAECMKDM